MNIITQESLKSRRKTIYHIVLTTILILTSLLLFVSSINSGDEGEYLNEAIVLKTAGIIRGTTTGFELEREPTRLEGLIAIIRLFGLEDEAMKHRGDTSVFEDVPTWGIPYVNYGYKMGFVKGISSNEFGSFNKLTSNQYLTFILRQLDYIASEDSNISTTNALAYSLNFLDGNTYQDIQTNVFTRDLLVHITYYFYINDVNLQYSLIQNTNIYVDQTIGNNSNNGSKEAPLKTIQQAIDIARAGDTICIRDGIYYESLYFYESGTEDAPITFYGKFGENIIIDGIKIKVDDDPSNNKPLVLFENYTDYIRLANLELRNSPDNGLVLRRSSYNEFYDLLSHDHNGSGFVSSGSYNKFYNCEAYYNYDFSYNGQHGDGFTFDEADGYGFNNEMYNCSSYYNADDGYDNWGGRYTLFKDSIAHHNGSELGNRNREFSVTNYEGNGNGFKLGIGIDYESYSTVVNCLSYQNQHSGFTTNDGGGSTIYNCTAYQNNGSGRSDRQFFLWDGKGDTKANTVYNSIAYPNDVTINDSSISTDNSWDLPVHVNVKDFISLDPNNYYFLELSSKSDLIGAGDSNGYSYSLGYTKAPSKSFIYYLSD